MDNVLRGINTYCVLSPGSVWATKQWPIKSFASVGYYFAVRGLRVIISGGKDDEAICKKVAEHVPGSVNACGRLTLRQSAELYRCSEFLLTGDTAPQQNRCRLAASGGAVLLAGGTAGKRFALPHAKVMIHQPYGGVGGQVSDIEIQANEILKTRDMLNEILSSHTSQTVERVAKDTDRDFYMTTEEARQYGIIDKIVK